jgi:uncharacterized OB-fold protein
MGSSLVALKCSACGRIFIPPKYVCPNCYSSNFTEIALSGEGEVQTFTTIYVPPSKFKDEAPYDVAVVKLKEGAHVLARIVRGKNEKVEIGSKVVFVEKKNGTYFFKLLT